MSAPLGVAKRRLVDRLKCSPPASTATVAGWLQVSATAARQHLRALEASGLVSASDAAPHGRGRPGQLWQLTDLASELFPDRHDDLTVEILDAVQAALGPEGLDHVIDARADAQLGTLRSVIPPDAPLGERVAALAEQRTAEGYMAGARALPDRGYELVEHHCPVRTAAATCGELCGSELELFREALGPQVSVERVEHLLGGGSRCAYRITPA